MKSILDVEVSCFANYNTPEKPASVILLQWLISDKYRAQVEQIRGYESKTDRDKVKATLPAITPSGTFSKRGQEFLIQHSGFLQFDIDWKENTHITNYQDLKRQICNIPNVAYCGLSVSGTGFWGLVPIAFPEKHRQHFEALEKAFAHFGIVIDPAPKNVASLRGYSYDPEPYFNHQATVYQVFIQPERIRYTPQAAKTTVKEGDRGKVEKCLAEIEKHRADLTGSYSAWFEIGCSLANSFGEDGRDYFHRVSQLYSDYSVSKTDSQFNHCLKGNYNYSLGTFLKFCADVQIRYKNLITDIPPPEIKPILEVHPLPPSEPNFRPSIVRTREEVPTFLGRASIYQEKEREQWDLSELENFFASATPPLEPVQLYPWAKVTDTGLFITSHLSYLRAHNGHRSAVPHLERLERLKSIMEGTAIQVDHTPLLHTSAA